VGLRVKTPSNPKKLDEENESPQFLDVKLNFPSRERRPSDLSYKPKDLAEQINKNLEEYLQADR